VRLAASDRIRVIHYGIDAEGWARDAPSRTSARASFGIEEQMIVIGIAARLIDGKGHAALIEAVGQAIRADDVPALLLVAGRGDERGRLEALAAAHCPPGRVQFLDFVEDIERLLAACDIVAFPTDGHGEGFGLTALEAMAGSRPVVATRFASLPEVVEDDVTGLLVAPGSVDELRRALVELAMDPTRRLALGEAGALRARRQFGLRRMASATRAVYNEVA
jgi:glycosyltransferase involved in cell wall biosynthesis